MGYEALVVVALVLHAGFLAYLAVGGYLAWWWPRTIWLHLITAAWGVTVVAASLTCPLTTLERWARAGAGQSVPDAGFIDRYLTGVIYPEDHLWTARIVLGVVVVVSWTGFVMRWRRRRAQQRASISGQAATYR
ncbi:DUF2784 domain-containing protein [Catenuloplanes indicus]|uniref:ABC-type phosphate transport system auxiliary subunit n=1 Tax=Catenuloplanes indicus TaxID=137267 RepID=A0AAE3W699_9ACTN|nr:DUF2784 domain-containing protein [Catenuloplanes indicus]MDQ0369175.1 ABC-type phosphate transport system auxiliary subunit [Catenuloplanes indicus]